MVAIKKTTIENLNDCRKKNNNSKTQRLLSEITTLNLNCGYKAKKHHKISLAAIRNSNNSKSQWLLLDKTTA